MAAMYGIDANSSVVSKRRAVGSVAVRPVQIWLLVIAACVFAMVVVGGATRLTGSGLSITEWQPVLGAVPPRSDAAWDVAFQKYRQIPQYERVNKGMTLSEFKTIYWWEWSHRFLGRAIGFVFLLPFAYFLWRRAIPSAFVGRIALLFVLGGSQGLVGWLMVKSGLSERVDVSQYRLAMHLGLATAIGGFALWLAMAIGQRPNAGKGANTIRPSGIRAISTAAVTLAAVIFAQILLGAFVAGLKAGHVSDTWPLMFGMLTPDGLGGGLPWYRSAFEDPLTAHFVHRLMGYFVVLAASACAVLVLFKRKTADNRLTIPIALVCTGIVVQIALGVATVVYAVPLPFALAHQANAIIVFALALWFAHRSRPNRRAATIRLS